MGGADSLPLGMARTKVFVTNPEDSRTRLSSSKRVFHRGWAVIKMSAGAPAKICRTSVPLEPGLRRTSTPVSSDHAWERSSMAG
jgi:hypothetical protein